MNLEFITFDGYGLYIWPAFIFTLASCFFLYSKTKRRFEKREKIFEREFKQAEIKRIKITQGKKSLSGKPVF